MVSHDPRPIYRDQDHYYSAVKMAPPQRRQQQHPRRSYGIMCVSEEGFVLMNESPSYFTQRSHYKTTGKFNVNSNIRNNLLMASFPYGTVEGQFGLPKGRLDAIDCGNLINTKIREFIEETRCYHPILLDYATQHYRDPSYISPFTDKAFQVVEEWIGLDNCLYWVEYTVIFIKSLDELIFLDDGPRTRDFILKEIPVIANASDKIKRGYRNKFHFVSRVDNQKNTIPVLLHQALFHMDCHKLQKFNSVTEMAILTAFKKYRLLHRILS